MIDYKEAWDYQEELFAKTVEIKIANRKLRVEEAKPTPNYLIFCTHPHVYTMGKSGDDKHLLIGKRKLKEIGATFYKINRGGDITYHGPGQIVCYPIIDLENFFTDIHKYLRLLEQAVIDTCSDFGVESGRIEGLTGVWVDHLSLESVAMPPRKISAFGVKSSRWVTMHGLAFNVNTDLRYFDNIVPCGIEDKEVTSLQKELGRELNEEETRLILELKILSLFGMDITM